MHIKHRAPLFYLGLSLLLTISFGCSTEKSVTQKILAMPAQSVANIVNKIMPDEKDNLKKRVLVFPFVDRSGLGPETATQTTEAFITLLKESPHILIYSSHETPHKIGESSPPEFGIVTDPKLIQTAENMDMNTLITGVINPVETNTKRTGIWPFRKEARIYEVSVVINVVDIFSKTLLLTHLESEEMLVTMDTEEVKHDEGFVDRALSKIMPSTLKEKASFDGVSVPLNTMESRYDRYLIDEALNKAMPRIMERQASVVIENLLEKPWTGKILTVDEGTIAINAGSDIGIKPSDQFEVFARAKLIAAGTDKAFDILGEKIGEIETTTVMEKNSVAVPLEEGTFSAGQIIRVKR